MKTAIKGTLIGSLIFAVTGFLGFAAFMYHQVFVLGVQDNAVIVEQLHSSGMRLLVAPFTMLCMALSVWLGTRRLQTEAYAVTIVLALMAVAMVSIYPVQHLIIHSNYLAIALGAVGGVLASKVFCAGSVGYH